MATLILLNKPFQVLSQFTDHRPEAAGNPPRLTLADFVHIPHVYPAGRLDYDSEGLLLLCDDGALQQRIANPRFKLWKRYLVQLEGQVTTQALQKLQRGVALRDGMTHPARAQCIEEPPLWPRNPPIRAREGQATSWAQIAIQEGRNRQLRRMCAHVGFPVLRLVRTAIGPWELADLAPGSYRREQVHMPAAATPAPGRGRPRRP